MDLAGLIPSVREIVKGYLWGDVDAWKRKLDIVRQLPLFAWPRTSILASPMNATCCERCGLLVDWWQRHACSADGFARVRY